MSHSTTVRRSAEKELKRVPAPDRRRIVEAIDGLKEDPPCRPRAEERSPGLAAHSGRRLARVIRSRRRDFGRIGVARRPPSRRLSPEGSMTALAAARVAPPVDSDVGEAPDALTLLLLPPSGGREGGDGVRTARRRGRWAAGHPPGPLPGGRTQDRGARGRRFLSSPLQGGGREGGPAPGSAGVPPASREARTRARAFGPPCRRDASTPRQLTDERDREGPRPGRRTPGSPPLPASPLPGGRRETAAARLPSDFSPLPRGRSDKAAHSRLLPGPPVLVVWI